MKRFLLLGYLMATFACPTDVVSAEQSWHREILLGQSCALKGPAKALGKGMRTGLTVYFEKVNSNGGIAGRQIKLLSLNDSYTPKKCIIATNILIKKRNVFAIIGEVGTPTSKVALPICESHHVPFIGPFTGAGLLRQPFRKWVVNLRGSYAQEMEMMAKLLVDERGLRKIACFYQDDAYGQAGLSGIREALTKRKLELCATGTYTRNTIAIANGLNSIAESAPDAVVMVGAYRACASFIKSAKTHPTLRKATFCNISFVGTKALLNELGAASEGCIVSQVVPYPWDESVPVVAEYQSAMRAAGKADAIGFVSLEGYLAAKLFCAVGEKVTGDFTRQAFLETLETVGTFDLGGVTVHFGPKDHQGMDEVFLTEFKEGSAVPLNLQPKPKPKMVIVENPPQFSFKKIYEQGMQTLSSKLESTIDFKLTPWK